ncbi:phage tail protein [Sulfitobacter pontiacus]
MGGGKGKSKRQVYDYFMSMDYGISHGPLDSINVISVKDKDAWVGPAMEDGQVRINQYELYGGDDGEGGPVGIAEMYMGDYEQVMSDALASRHGLTATTAPAYRGIAHVFFRGGSEQAIPQSNQGIFGVLGDLLGQLFFGRVPETSRKGFLWTSNNPYLPAAVINATRGPVGLTKSLVYPIVGVNEAGQYEIAVPGDAFTVQNKNRVIDRTRLPDANPAAMIYECMTNADWGKGEPVAAFDKASYERCAAVLKAEHFGLTLFYTRQDTIESYVSEILDHILGVQYQDPTTGLWTMDLIRGDYDTADLLVLDPSNCDIDSTRTKAWGETVNEIKVSYTDPVSGDEETVTAQNLSNIAIQGGTVSDARDYHGVRNPYLAKIIAERDVAAASRALISTTIRVNRDAYDLRPANVVLLNWPEEEIVEVPFRVMGIDYGTPKDRTIKLEVVEDVYGTPPLQIAPVSQPVVDYDVDPLPKNPDRLMIMTPPLPPLIRSGISVAELDANYPQSEVQFFVSDSTVQFLDTLAVAELVLPNGAYGNVTVATIPPSYARVLEVPLVQEARSTIPEATIINITGGDPEIGELLVIGSSEEVHELIMLDSYDEDAGLWTVMRGMYDTVPLAWTPEDILWLLPLSEATLDNRENIAGDPQTYRFLPRTRHGPVGLRSGGRGGLYPERTPAPAVPACRSYGGR